MSETKKDQNEDIITSAQDAPEAIGDEALEDANGGWSWGVNMATFNTTTTTIQTNIDAETITASGPSVDTTALPLRWRPGRI